MTPNIFTIFEGIPEIQRMAGNGREGVKVPQRPA
jgi:hypothetical protein